MAKQSLQPSRPDGEESLRHPDIPGRLRQLLGARIEREIYLSTEEAAQLTGRPSRAAFIQWARRNGVPLRKPSPSARRLMIKKSDLDFALRSE